MTRKTKKTIKLGFVSGLSGVYGWMANNQLNGVTLAVEEINKKAGIAGRQIEIFVKDDKSDSKLAVKVVRELIQKDKVDIIIGQLSAGTQLAVNKETKKAKMLFMSLGQTNELTMAPYLGKYTFHQALTPHMTVQSMAKWIFENLGKRWFIILADYEWGWHALEGYKSFAKRTGVKIIGAIKIPFPVKEKDAFTKHFPKIIRKNPEVLIGANYGLDQLRFIEDVNKAGLKRKMSIVNTLSEIGIIDKLNPDDAVGMYWGATFYWGLQDTLPIAKRFVSLYRKRFKEIPSAYSAYGYSGAMEVLGVAQEIGEYPINSEKVTKELEGRTYAHYKEREWWRPCDHQAFQEYYIFKLKGPEERKSKDDSSEVVGGSAWDLDFGRTCKSIGHVKKMWGHIK